jgi:hypothetical protein
MKDFIERRAFEMWKAAGEPSGLDLDFWLAAEKLEAIEDGGRSDGATEPDAQQGTSEAPLSEVPQDAGGRSGQPAAATGRRKSAA